MHYKPIYFCLTIFYNSHNVHSINLKDVYKKIIIIKIVLIKKFSLLNAFASVMRTFLLVLTKYFQFACLCEQAYLSRHFKPLIRYFLLAMNKIIIIYFNLLNQQINRL